MSSFQFNPANVSPQTEVQIAPSQSRPADFRTDAERIADARARAMASSIEANASGAHAGFDLHESFFRDFAGSETSWWDARRWVHIAGMIEAPILQRSKFVWPTEAYDPRTAQFNLSDAQPISLDELKAAVKARIKELELSEPLIWEYLSVPHDWADSRAFDNLSFEQRMTRFKQA